MKQKTPSLLLSLVPIFVLIAMMFVSVLFFGSDCLLGASQVSILVAIAVCVALSKGICHVPWKQLEAGMRKTLGEASIPIMILLMIGLLSGTWMVSGIVPTFIYYGVQIMSPKFFLLSTCLICGAISLLTGSSWTTIATIGVALIAIGNALGISECWTAGAIISGAYFGDKISPLSDTTILASSSAGTELFTHIRYMLITTVPSFLIALIVFGCEGFFNGGTDEIHVAEYTEGLKHTFNISLWLLIVPVITGYMVFRKVPSVIALFVSSVLAAIVAVIAQPELLSQVSRAYSTGGSAVDSMPVIRGVFVSMFTTTTIETGNASLNELVSTSGMAGMLDTIWLILCSMSFGGAMVASGMIGTIAGSIIRCVRNRVGMVAATVSNGLLFNLTASDQYLSILMTFSIFRNVFSDNGYEPRLLSRSTEDSATVTSVLIPWNSCGMTQSTVLGVPTMAYLPYCIFNYVSPLMSVAIAAIGFKIYRVTVKSSGENSD